MSTDRDFIIALQLQEQFENETNMNQVTSFNQPKQTKTMSVAGKVNSNSPNERSCVVDPLWEYIDPTPDIHALFIQFDRRFFWTTLKQVEVRWSPRMTSCAGICCYEGRGGLCSIRLSVLLLKLRPRKDLVETLLHEMIHAYLFVTHNNRDRDGHGPEFQKHMYRINKEAGTNITIYHSFHDEVNLYRQHWWRCSGPCRKRPPYFGLVKRAMNRHPGPSDYWWIDHERNCCGRFIKIKEPEGFSEKKAKQNKTGSQDGLSSKMGDIRKFVSVHENKNSDRMKNGSGDLVKGTNVNRIVSLNDMQASNIGNVKNRVTFPTNHIVDMKDLNANSSVNSKNKFTSKNITSDKDKRNGSIKSPTSSNTSKNGPFSGGRGLLANKGSGTVTITSKGNNGPQNVSNKECNYFVPFSGKGFTLGTSNTKSKTVTSNEMCTDHESKMSLKRHASLTEENVNTKRSKNNVESMDGHSDDIKTECPVCGIKVNAININSHLDSCLQSPSSNKLISENDQNTCSGSSSESESDIINCPACNKKMFKYELDSHLKICLESIFESNRNESDVDVKCSLDEDDKYPCPCCSTLQKYSVMNSHLDHCLG